jgi:hypothetical protein
MTIIVVGYVAITTAFITASVEGDDIGFIHEW